MFNAASTAIFNTVQILDESNWFDWSKQMKMFFVGCGARSVTTGTPPAKPEDLAAFNEVDGLLPAFIYAKVSPHYQYLVEDEETATAAWTKLKAYFEKSTMGHRMAARRAFHTVKHDAYMSIAAYIQAVTSARAKLEAFGCTVTDTECVDVMLMNLDESFSTIRTTILAQKNEPDLKTVKAMLMDGSSNTVNIKIENSNETALGGCGYRASAHVRPSRPRLSTPNPSANPIDEKGYRWCDPNNENCRRCGRRGHIAINCMIDMPQPVKDWLMTHSSRSSSRSRSPPPYKAHIVATCQHSRVPGDPPTINHHSSCNFHEPDEHAF